MSDFNPEEAARLATMYVTNHEWCSAAAKQLAAAVEMSASVNRHDAYVVWREKARRLSARVRELEAYVEMAADILDSCAARHSNADASVTATKIRAALAKKETL